MGEIFFDEFPLCDGRNGLLILPRGHAECLFEDLTEVGMAAEAAFFADLADGEICVLQQVLGRYDAGVQNVVHYRNAGGFLEFFAEIKALHIENI